MISKLWQYFLQDDVENFRELLANTSYANTHKDGGNAASNTAHKLASPGGISLGSSPNIGSKNKRTTGTSFNDKGFSLSLSNNNNNAGILTRADVNAKDRFGRTLLHFVASSGKESAFDFAAALLTVPCLDLYVQDLESGWTALHRALYAGNVSIAQAILSRDIKDAVDFNSSGNAHHHHPFGGLIKIKDREGNSPFEVFGATIAARNTIQPHDDLSDRDFDSGSNASTYDRVGSESDIVSHDNFHGDEVFTFGSNKNLSLGQGDEDDRQFPERIALTRPEYLLQQFYDERERIRRAQRAAQQSKIERIGIIEGSEKLPTIIHCKPIIIQDVVMSKLHTGIITNDPVLNLYMCGFGPGGRLGTGDEVTRFNFVCIEFGEHRIVRLALGQDHSIAISDQGEVFSWGSNKYGQLGYTLPKTNQKNDTPVQTGPRQIFNPFKREVITGAAASSIHSVVCTSSGLYTFGKNEGQLGLTDADARSLKTQVIPRRVGAGLFNTPILMVSAIDRATTCLLENHDVWVFTHYGYSRLVFPLDGSSSFLRDSFLTTRYGFTNNHISKITSGGNTICAMSSYGEVYTVNASRTVDTHSTASSTTNPAKIRNSLPQPSRVWSIKKSHMAVRDVDVGQDGSIIICTESGSAWLKEKRAKIKDVAGGNRSDSRRVKDYKFVRVPGISRAVAVRSNAFGAYSVIQRTCDVAKKNIFVQDRHIWRDLWPLLPYKDIVRYDEYMDVHILSRSSTSPFGQEGNYSKKTVRPLNLEPELRSILQLNKVPAGTASMVWISSSSSDIRIPVHEFMISARCPFLKKRLSEFRKKYYFTIPDFVSIEYDKDGQVQIQFQDFHLLSIFNFTLFLYTDKVYDVWFRYPNNPLYRRVRTEIVKLAANIGLLNLEMAVRVMIEPRLCLPLDMENAIKHPSFFKTGDVIIELDGGEIKAHSHILCQRCPFFDGLFHGRAAGRWLSSRLEGKDNSLDAIRVDLKHIEPSVFKFVLRYIYADTDDELFENVAAAGVDELIDLVIDVMSAANELMLDRLCQICQKLLGTFVNTRNVCHLLNAVAPCSVTEFKQAALIFICMNLEVMLQNRFLDDLDPDLLPELDKVCQRSQYTCQPISRRRNTEQFFAKTYPKMVPLIEQDKQRRIDGMRLRSHLHEDEMREGAFKTGSLEKTSPVSPLARKGKQAAIVADKTHDLESPTLRPKKSTGDLIFDMDEEHVTYGSSGGGQFTSSKTSRPPHYDQSDAKSTNSDVDNERSAGPAGFRQDSGLPFHTQQHTLLGNSPAKAPWGPVTPCKTKTGIKDIIAESSTSGPSAIFSDTPSRRETDVSRNFSPKLSQKERKKLKQQQMNEATAEQQQPSSSSPWKIAGPKPKTSFLSQSPQPATTSTTPTDPTPKTSLNLRQTIAGASLSQPKLGPSASSPHAKSPYTPPQQKQQKQQKQQRTPLSSDPNTAATNFDKITPSPSTNSATQVSLTSILYQQQTEKDVIREAATAKHNLHDIQVEQEFQAWWDQESRRLMQQSETQTETAKKNSKHEGGSGNGKNKKANSSSNSNSRGDGGGGGGSSRGGPSKRRGGRVANKEVNTNGGTGAGASVTTASTQVATDTSGDHHGRNTRAADDRKRHHGRGRGTGRGRGGGGDGHGRGSGSMRGSKGTTAA